MKKIIFILLFPVLCYSATITRYIDPDVVGGLGNGTSWANAYSSMNAWEAAEQTDLVSDTNIHIVYCRASSGTADATSTTINGWTTGASNYILIEAADGDQAVKTGIDANRYRLAVTDGTCLFIYEDYVRINKLQIQPLFSATSTYYGTDIANQTTNNDIRISNCYYDANGGTRYGIRIWDADANLKIWNTIFTVGNRGFLVGLSGADVEMYNSIVYGSAADGVEYQAGTTGVLKNNAIFNNNDDIDNAGTVTIDYVASDDGDGTNAVAASGGNWANEYNNVAGGDYTLLNGGNCYQGGADNPSSGLYTTDMEGDSYNGGAYSIGVDEYVVAPSGVNRKGQLIKVQLF